MENSAPDRIKRFGLFKNHLNLGFDSKPHTGEMIVNKKSHRVLDIFVIFTAIVFKIEKMQLH